MIGRNSEVLTFGDFRFVPGDGLWRHGRPVAIPPRALAVLTALLSTPGSVVLKQDLMNAAWPGTFVTESSLLEAIGLLREVLGDDRRQPTFIQTVHRRGYRFIAPVGTGGYRVPTVFLRTRVAADRRRECRLCDHDDLRGDRLRHLWSGPRRPWHRSSRVAAFCDLTRGRTRLPGRQPRGHCSSVDAERSRDGLCRQQGRALQPAGTVARVPDVVVA